MGVGYTCMDFRSGAVLSHVPTEHGRARPSWTDSSRVVAEGQSREFCLRRAEACRYQPRSAGEGVYVEGE